ncbi:MAG: hypothetical protein JO107_10275 [Hyphomicrobiales bacterium]|nr:hypothetical protein [Hyphomicrobiales bacterium]MBV8663476.1 hypothetical protein [Hyphomicrobiales bacterium]
MFSRIRAAFVAALIALVGLAPAFALNIDPTKIIPARGYPGQTVQYYRATINFNDPRIASGVWFGTLPQNAYILSIDAQVVTAFNAGTTNTVTIGATAANANEIVASGITAGTPGIYHLTSAAGLGNAITNNTTYQTALNGAVPLYAKYAQTGTAATAGQVIVIVAFVKNDDL